ncbi:carbamoyl-phosphate synthase L chain, ATP binding domain-containing protein [Ditylenchus destructor]|nr:carbamoyl-phosphate synthase L chain, ATP binding domain-containing protein [Ditylenchus destructor]
MHGFEEMKATLILEDGTKFVGQLFGAAKSVSGELVFQTGMVGYTESLTDPSYAKQLLTLTYPLIGNYGVADDSCSSTDVNMINKLSENGFESHKIWPSALIVGTICPNTEHSHWQAVQSLADWLRKSGIPGLAGIDVRLLTKRIREHGTLKAKLVIDADDSSSIDFVDIYRENLVEYVSRKDVQNFGSGSLKILAVDCGLKYNQIRCLANRNCTVTIVPYDFPINEKLQDYDGLFLSNGPGDPAMCSGLIKRLSAILAQSTAKPVFGICLGHQLLARAAGATTHKLLYGNRGHNQPCTHLDTQRCFITAQNHGFAVDAENLPDGWAVLFSNENDGTNEGIVHKDRPFFSVQFHPEHCAGPTDMECLFDVFIDAVQKSKSGNTTYNLRNLITEKLTYDHKYVIPEQRKVLILGSGGLSIGQAGEFDYSGAQAIKALKELHIKTVLINPNVATVQTSKGFADRVYFLPITKEYVTEVIKKERPTGLLCTFGGQTALNCAIDLYKDGILEQFNVAVLGTPIQTIMNTEDREKFNQEIESINEHVATSMAATTVEGAEEAAEKIGYPVLVRAAFALGGLGSGFAHNRAELVEIAKQALAHSNQVLVDKSLKGWKEIEYEVVRDAYDNCIAVCNMENIDPLGIHTGESVVVAPSQTLSDHEYNKLRDTAIKVIRHFGVIGECNIQYALNPNKLEYYIIEVNARLSRSSALASKATGYPLAYIAAKLALGESLVTLRNSVTGKTTACFEPSLDYCVVKIPRWDLSKFARVNNRIGSSMKSVGEVMGIGRSFEEGFQKALRMVNDNYEGFSPFSFKRRTEEADFTHPTDKRILLIARALYKNDFTLEQIHEMTKIDRWFLYRMQNIVDIYKRLENFSISSLPESLLHEAKQLGFSDAQIAKSIDSAEGKVRELRKSKGIKPFVKQIDTVAAEWPAVTNYLYLTYNGAEHDVNFDLKSNGVVVLGSGVYRIGSSVEFDASCVGCVQELKRQEYKTIMINCNPETVSTDFDICDRLYFEEISLEAVSNIYELENPAGVILAFGGQSANNIALSLQKANLDVPIRVFGTHPKYIDEAEDRYKFSRALDELKIEQPLWKNATTIEEALKFCDNVGYPCLIRPSYVLSGAAMNVAHNPEDLVNFLKEATGVAKDKPVVVSKFLMDAKEIDVDVVSLSGKVLAMAISEHVENAGIHSGDATLVTPPQDLNEETEKKIRNIVYSVARRFKATGPFNMQLIAKDNELFVIECNLRVSRSFPFVSKTLDYDFVALATKAVMHPGDHNSLTYDRMPIPVKVGVKVPQFSFSRLAGADVVMGVEMLSTGEVACFGRNRFEAYLKGLLSTGFMIPKKAIFLSIGGVYAKEEMLESVKILYDLGYELCASKGTADFYDRNNISIKAVEWPFDDRMNQTNYGYGSEKMGAVSKTISDFMSNKDIDLIINLPIRGSGSYRVSAYRTHGYKTRRMAIDNGIPLITDIKCAKLFIKALRETQRMPPSVNSQLDCLSSENLIRLPGLIDIHVHVREPGGEHKETWQTCTRAALAGGVTLILAMPNTNPPLIDEQSYDLVEKIASQNALCDYALYLGATPENIKLGKTLGEKCAGLKMYLNETFAALQMPSILDWIEHMKTFPSERPIVCHAEQSKQTLAAVIAAAQIAQRKIHICHVSTAEEIALIRMAKERGLGITCEVCPHHLFLTNDKLDDGWREVRPRLSDYKTDCEALWKNMEYIDCFATDHAPHTKDEKGGPTPPPGFPGVQYMLPLLLTAVVEKKLTMEQLIDRIYNNPRKIFRLPEQQKTFVEVDMNEEWTIPENGGESKCNWSPYKGMNVRGKVRTVVIRGEEVFVDGQFTVQPGFGKNIRLIAEPVESIEDLEVASEMQVAKALQKEAETTKGASPDRLSPPRALSSIANPFYGQNILSVTQFTDKAMINQLLDLANRFHNDIEVGRSFNVLRHSNILGLAFYEPSTRTMMSFESAVHRLGGNAMRLDVKRSSVQKGESLEDTMQMLSNYCEVIALRHPEVSACHRAILASKKPIINAGDGTEEHPTQAFLDLYTIRQELSTVNNKTIALVGDLKHGRTVHSLAKILCLYHDITIHYVSPNEELGIPDSVTQYVNEHSNFPQKKFTDLLEGIRDADVIYMTRIQRERFSNPADYDKVKGKFVLTPKLLNQASSSPVGELLETTRVDEIPQHRKQIVMHPLPRLDEISTELDKDPRAVYFRQAQYGVYTRMALLTLVLGAQY